MRVRRGQTNPEVAHGEQPSLGQMVQGRLQQPSIPIPQIQQGIAHTASVQPQVGDLNMQATPVIPQQSLGQAVLGTLKRTDSRLNKLSEDVLNQAGRGLHNLNTQVRGY